MEASDLDLGCSKQRRRRREFEFPSKRRTNMVVNRNTFQALADTEVLVLGSNGNLWLEHGLFRKVLPLRQQADGNVQAFPESFA
jgi:hypothetical protein